MAVDRDSTRARSANHRHRGFRRLGLRNWPTAWSKHTSEDFNHKEPVMKKESPPPRAWKEIQGGTASKESYDGFAALVGVWSALRRTKKASGR